MKTLFQLLTTIFLLSFNTVSSAESLDPQLLQSLGDVRYHELASKTLKRPFHIFVDLPGDYATNTETYPTIYLLDGGTMFPLLAAYHHYLNLGEEVPGAILVGISYGSDDFREGNFRSTDFTAASDERDFWGGAPAFQEMLADELLPMIESRYRSNPAQRVIFGQSLGGQFVLFNALTRPALFYGHIASNPALHRNLPFFLEWRGGSPVPVNTSHVFVSSGQNDNPRFRVPAMKWIEHWQGVPEKPWRLETRTLAGQTHFSAVPLSFRQGMQWLFPEINP